MRFSRFLHGLARHESLAQYTTAALPWPLLIQLGSEKARDRNELQRDAEHAATSQLLQPVCWTSVVRREHMLSQ